MKKKSLIVAMVLSIFLSINALSQGPYSPPAGQSGSTAIYKDSSIIKSWATGIELYRGWVNIADTTVKYNGSNKATFAYPSIALGKAQESSYDVVSLGDGGVATLTFDRPIVNGQGADFVVFENGFSDTFLELAFVEVSSDGEHFVRLPAVSLTQTATQVGGFGALDATNLYNLAGNFRQGYGTPFDLDDIIDSTNIDLNNIRFVRVVDVVGNIDPLYATYDSKGNKVNDPWPTSFHSCGFDLDAIGIINSGVSYQLSDMDDLVLPVDSFWNGSNQAGSFISDMARYYNNYNTTFGSWSGFSYSSMRDNTTAGYTNQYSAITRGGMNAADTGGTNYAVGFVPLDWMGGTYDAIPIQIDFTDSCQHKVSGFYVTNNTYAALSMKNGDSFAKKFGGASGNDPDYFKLLIFGEKEDGSKTDTVDFYLADYRFADNSKDYIVENWRWLDLYKLGAVKKLYFSLESSDIGAYGMNTPAYFCLDNLTILPAEAGLMINTPIADVTVNKNAPPLPIDLSSAFTACDTSLIVLAVASNSNASLVSTDLSGKTLTLTFSADQTGEAEIVISASIDSITVTDTFEVTVNNTTGIENNLANNVKVYPNPCTSIINVECDADSRIILIDIYGKTIKEKISTGNTVQLTTEQLTQGYYILKVVGQTKNTAVKILKQ